ncbi:hypothetical protein [Donghicola eburneus]|uniref:hypothetical protein n=1 Tax=Donghicola eburneus TaxID=393278 RepID=UPI0008E6CD66|nr:hypothetical protein [Donghicola eburneus]SFQ74475.1 hypothetical protein SAMN05421764_1151 [Donghicola eburneus]
MKINLNKEHAVEAMLKTVNGKAKNFTITTSSHLKSYYVELAEKKLAEVLPKAAWTGATVECRPEGPSSMSYRYSAKSTRCVLKRGAKDWFLVRVEKDRVYPQSRKICDVTLTDKQALASIEHRKALLVRDYGVSEEVLYSRDIPVPVAANDNSAPSAATATDERHCQLAEAPEGV